MDTIACGAESVDETDDRRSGVQVDQGNRDRLLRIKRWLVGVVQFGDRQDGAGGGRGGPFEGVGETG
ncbi:MAG TPA: hypothetical protein VL614_02775 [Acetobacteraceae bacterium]|nr:hypothetical protein [Acetobacteraceae bacterium]